MKIKLLFKLSSDMGQVIKYYLLDNFYKGKLSFFIYLKRYSNLSVIWETIKKLLKINVVWTNSKIFIQVLQITYNILQKSLNFRRIM